VSLLGAILTIALNLYWIPEMGYVGSAWATLVCYASMAFISYSLGQYYYPVPYQVKRLLAYISLGLALYWAKRPLLDYVDWQTWLLSSALLSLYLLTALLFERRKRKKC
jgi:O-antigen/teichoic acid export membrane protein